MWRETLTQEAFGLNNCTKCASWDEKGAALSPPLMNSGASAPEYGERCSRMDRVRLKGSIIFLLLNCISRQSWFVTSFREPCFLRRGVGIVRSKC
jgi:hypothetical protein